jgi:hypothetical protein
LTYAGVYAFATTTAVQAGARQTTKVARHAWCDPNMKPGTRKIMTNDVSVRCAIGGAAVGARECKIRAPTANGHQVYNVTIIVIIVIQQACDT